MEETEKDARERKHKLNWRTVTIIAVACLAIMAIITGVAFAVSGATRSCSTSGKAGCAVQANGGCQGRPVGGGAGSCMMPGGSNAQCPGGTNCATQGKCDGTKCNGKDGKDCTADCDPASCGSRGACAGPGGCAR